MTNEDDSNRRMNIIAGLVADCLTCTDPKRVMRSSQNISDLVRERPKLEGPISRYAECLRGNVDEGRLNAFLSIIREEANGGRCRWVEGPVLKSKPTGEEKMAPGKQPIKG